MPVAVVNETFAASIAGTGAPVIGTRFTREPTPGAAAKTFEIVGVVRNSTYADLKEGAVPVAFLSEEQATSPAYLQLVVRSSLPVAAMTSAMTRTFADVDPRIGVAYSVLTTQIQDTVVRERLLATLSGGFGILAAILTLVGLYGLIAYTVTRRTNEIGVRMALGAGRGAIARLILRETGTAAGGGCGARRGSRAGRRAGRGDAALRRPSLRSAGAVAGAGVPGRDCVHRQLRARAPRDPD